MTVMSWSILDLMCDSQKVASNTGSETVTRLYVSATGSRITGTFLV